MSQVSIEESVIQSNGQIARTLAGLYSQILGPSFIYFIFCKRCIFSTNFGTERENLTQKKNAATGTVHALM